MTPTTGQPTPLYRSVVRACRARRRKPKISDSTGAELSGGAVLLRALVLRRLLRRHVLAPVEERVGVLLPQSAAAVVTNLALALDRRVAVNLNYTLSSDLLNRCLAQAGIRHVLTSRRVLERFPLQIDAELVFLEDLKDRPTTRDKLVAAAQAHAFPTALLVRALGLQRVTEDDLLTVVFTSGSTGDPKGAMLTHGNVAATVRGVNAVTHLRPTDVVLGVLPFFHAYGYAVTLWTALTLDVAAAYHPNPLDGRGVGQLCHRKRGTILLATPMFLRNYLRRCDPEEFATLEVVAGGGERLPHDLADAFEAKFGVRPVEGYGTTETTSVIASNIPPTRAVGDPAATYHEGTVGQPVPGVEVKIVDQESGAELGPDHPGLLWVRGPIVMRGYLDRPDATAAVLRDGWYNTGDIARRRPDGFVEIVGRVGRFAKIAGEMVPHVRVEEALTLLAGTDDEGMPRLAVTSVPDPVKGERLVVVHAPLDQSPADLCRGLAAAGLPPLYIPSPAAFVPVDRLPTIGTGKIDLKRIDQLARDRTATPQPLAPVPTTPSE